MLAIALASTVALLGGGSATLHSLTSASASPTVSYPLPYPGDPNMGVANQGTRTTNFDSGWLFKLVSTTGTTDSSGVYGNSSTTPLPPAAAVSFNDSSWQSVTLPHDWSITVTPAASNPGANGYEPGGLGWYRKYFTLPAADAGKEISIDFDGVFDNSFVYVNGTPAPVIGRPVAPIAGCTGTSCAAGGLPGGHPYGYSTFSVDVTGLVHTDGTPNVVAVVVQNLEPSSRWYSGSGITRHVHLTVTNPVHIARYGTFVTTPNLQSTLASSGNADVHVATSLVNQSGADSTDDVTYTVRDASGAVVATTTSSGVSVPATAVVGSPVVSSNDMTVANPTLWSPSTPYLYTLQTDVSQGGTVIDSTTTTFGIRWLVVDPNDGVFVNGQHIKLQGVDLHQDEGALGSVNNYDALYREMSILKSMGVNAFRTSHNPPSPEMIDVCQRLGILMMVEAFDTWDISGKVSQDYHLYYPVWHNYDIQDMVNEAKNSPAVLQWSIGNEIPSWSSTSTDPQATNLIADIKSIDSTRPVVGGSDQYRSLPSGNSGDITKLNMLDGLGLNYNPALVVDQLHQAYPSKFFFESESSSETSSRGTYLNPELNNTGPNMTPGKYNVSSYDNNLASWTMSDEYGLKKDRDRPYFAGQFIWSGFDYIGEPTPYSVFPVKGSFFGTIDTAGFPKDAYYAFQSQWTTKPMVHVVPMNWTDYTPGQTVQVWVDTNQAGAKLSLNGVDLGPPVAPFVQKTSQVTGTAPWLNSNTNTLDGPLYPNAPFTGPLALPTVTVPPYYETTNDCPADDKQYTTAKTGSSTCVGSYQSPNNGFTEPNATGSSGRLHLTWNVPFAPGKLVATATDASGNPIMVNGSALQDEQDTAGPAYTLTLTPDKRVITDDGKALSYFTINVVDSNGVMVPDASNQINFSVTGAGSFAGADNGNEDSAENYTLPTHAAFNGKALLIVQAATTPGPITVTASSDGLVPVTTTIYSADPTATGQIATTPVSLRTPQGASLTLPATVQGVNADGTTSSLPVTWSTPNPAVGPTTGVFTINGTVTGGGTAQAIVTVYNVGSVQTYSTAVAVGTAPTLPAQLKVQYDDGNVQYLPVTWASVDPSQYAAAGQFTVAGTVAVPGFAGTSAAVANVRVTSTFASGSNLAAAASTAKPSADADYSGSTSEVPANLIDTSTTSLWANKYSEGSTNILPTITNSNHRDWVQVSWPTVQHFNTINPFFTLATGYELPRSVVVTYWNGASWVPVTNQVNTLSTTSLAMSTITFDPIGTTSVRLWMVGGVDSGTDTGGALVAGSSTTGNLGIAQLQVQGNLVALNSTATLSDLQVNGATIAGFSPATTSYASVPANATPVITATAANNGSVVITPPLSVPGTAKVTVTSEDGSASTAYTLSLVSVAPTTAASFSPAAVNGWYNQNPSVTLTATPGTSSVTGTMYQVDGGSFHAYTAPFTISGDGTHTLSFYSTDSQNDTETTKTQMVQIDTVAPTTSAALSPAAVGGYYVNPTVTLTAGDGTGSGVASSQYQIDGGGFQTYSAPFAVTGDGPHTVQFRSTDVAGNTETVKSTTFTVDATAPTTTASIAPAAVNGYNHNSTVTLSAGDGTGSGVATTTYQVDGGGFQTYSAPFAITGDGAHTLQFRSTDKAGNVEATNTQTVQIDNTKTVTTAVINGVTVPANATNFTATAPANVVLSAVDPLVGAPTPVSSGVNQTWYSVNGGTPVLYAGKFVLDPLNGNTSGGGNLTLKYWSTDKAGNVEDPTITLLVLPAVPVGITGNVPSTLSVATSNVPPSLGAFVPGVAAVYTATLGATVTTTAATSTLTASDTSSSFPGHLVNTTASGGPYGLAQGLQVAASDPANTPGTGTFSDLSLQNPATLLSYPAPVANDPVTVSFKQPVSATDPLRTGTYSKTITLTLSTSTP